MTRRPPKIPRAREMLLQAHALISEALPLLNRVKADFRAPKESNTLTPIQREKVRMMRKKGMSQKKIAERFGVHPGRISEAIHEGDSHE
jgi:DNA-directed RNA polymerase specialized sigma24 family protein